MILEIENWSIGYKQILHDIRSTPSATILLISAMDTDAICSARIFSYLLRSDNISYQLRPCTSYPDLVSIFQNLPSTVSGVVLLNLGISKNLTKLVKKDGGGGGGGVTLYVIDCHRPFHLANAYAGREVVLFLDEGMQDDIPSDGDGLSGDEDSDDDDSDSEEEEESEGEEEWKDGDDAVVEKEKEKDEKEEEKSLQDENDVDDSSSSSEPAPKRRRTDDSSSSSNETQEEEPPSTTQDDSTKIKQQSQTNTQMSIQDRLRSRRERISAYYNTGTYHTAPSSWITYTLSTQLRHTNTSDLLWLSCIGLTSSYFNSRLSSIGYTHLASHLRSHVSRLYPSGLASHLSQQQQQQQQQQRFASDNTSIQTSDNGLIISEPEFPFFLLRQTGLYESLLQSDIVALKFRTWRRDGVALLREWLAKMGFPLDECQQPFAFMKPQLRKRLKVAIERTAAEYGFESGELCFDGFVRVTGFRSLISASDVSHAVSALLEAGGGGRDGDGGGGEGEGKSSVTANFNDAYDALNAQVDLNRFVNGCRTPTKLRRGIHLACELQKRIIMTAVNLREKDALVTLIHFRYAFLHHGNDNGLGGGGGGGEDREITDRTFCQPLALARLAKFLMGMTWRKRLPLVLLSEKPGGDYLVVGYTNGGEDDDDDNVDVTKNRFETYFELAANTMVKNVVKFETFLGNAVEVEGASVQRFVEQLHYVMDEV